MWQRIQSVFLALVVVFNTAIFWLTLAKVQLDGVTFDFTLYKLVEPTSGEVLANVTLLAILCSLPIVMAGITLGMFKRRQLQIKLAQLLLLIQAAFLVGIFFIVDNEVASLTNYSDKVVEYSLGSYLALIPLIFIFLAIKSIKKDEALVRAADRIR